MYLKYTHSYVHIFIYDITATREEEYYFLFHLTGRTRQTEQQYICTQKEKKTDHLNKNKIR